MATLSTVNDMDAVRAYIQGNLNTLYCTHGQPVPLAVIAEEFLYDALAANKAAAQALIRVLIDAVFAPTVAGQASHLGPLAEVALHAVLRAGDRSLSDANSQADREDRQPYL